MNDPHPPSRREQLFADAALGWLSHEDETAFAALQRAPDAAAELHRWEQAAAVPVLALTDVDEPLPQPELEALIGKLQLAATRHFAGRNAPTGADRGQPQPAAAAPRTTPISSQPQLVRPPLRLLAWRALPWALAAAALLLALRPWHSDALPARERDALLRAGTATLCAWQPGPSPMRGDVHGDVVWDPTRQQGYLRLAGLPPLDPDHRYQLWIVDRRREGPPVDGGVLAPLTRDGEVVIPVTPRLLVHEAAAFVLTVEPADGVVVSAQKHVVAIATP